MERTLKKKWEILIPWRVGNSRILEISKTSMIQVDKCDEDRSVLEYLVSTDNSIKIRLPRTIETLSLTDLGDCYLRKHLYIMTRQLADSTSPVRMIVKGYSKLSKDVSNSSPRMNSIDEALSYSTLHPSPIIIGSLPSEELVKSKPVLDLRNSLDELLEEVEDFLSQNGVSTDDPRLKCTVHTTVDEVNQTYGMLSLILEETDA